MKKILLGIFTLTAAAFTLPASANDMMVASTMQRCTANEECMLVTNSCSDNCGFVPVNKSNLTALQTLYQSRCNKPMEANPSCNMNPPIAAACINSRCTIDYAYANHAGAKDYQAGANPTPEKTEASKVQGDYSKVDDRSGNFNAYDLPQGSVKQGTVGQINTTVYVPPSAPVSGGSYVPLGSVPEAPLTAPQVPNAVAPPANVPPSYAPPANIPPAAVPAPRANATPVVVREGQPAPVPPQYLAKPQPAPAPQQYVPAPTEPTVPAPGLPPEAAVPRGSAPAAIPATGAPGVPQAPAGSTPIPPSDLKPAPTFVPPVGTPVKAAPEDPGAPPPAGTTMTMMPAEGKPGMTVSNEGKTGPKSFGAKPDKKSTYNLN